ncbi:DUF4157 domain-containing protein [Aquihabitans sp. G128]|uniref:DUF4157 domain-containing protein n=1 Tax=Aquihabitans sp. G128 TaxID=2849779 RepID=UPI001C242FE1|nr:DUF4157 domain-containing protein [Aquihabitans sp. G128]QXC61541.1 DUF4157 domain-containing protein [Aquihabitans sp. G128]
MGTSLRIGRIEQRPGYRLWVGGPVPHGADAWTLGSLVIVRARFADRTHLLTHELEHVRQWREQGPLGFLRAYLAAYVGWRLRLYPHAAAYRRIPAEVAAEWRARRRLHLGCDGPA